MKMNYFVFGTNNIEQAVAFYDELFDGCGLNKMQGQGRMILWGNEEFMFAIAPPDDFISSTKTSSSCWRLAATTTFAPCSAKSFAVARPIPELAPVTIATLLVNEYIPNFLFCLVRE